jgi:hypothetical protein
LNKKKTQAGHTNFFVQVNEIASIKRGKIKEKIQQKFNGPLQKYKALDWGIVSK